MCVCALVSSSVVYNYREVDPITGPQHSPFAHSVGRFIQFCTFSEVWKHKFPVRCRDRSEVDGLIGSILINLDIFFILVLTCKLTILLIFNKQQHRTLCKITASTKIGFFSVAAGVVLLFLTIS